MIETLTMLAALMAGIQHWMADPTWPAERSWSYTVSSSLTDTQLTAQQPLCCTYLLVPGSAAILRVENRVVLVKR